MEELSNYPNYWFTHLINQLSHPPMALWNELREPILQSKKLSNPIRSNMHKDKFPKYK